MAWGKFEFSECLSYIITNISEVVKMIANSKSPQVKKNKNEFSLTWMQVDDLQKSSFEWACLSE